MPLQAPTRRRGVATLVATAVTALVASTTSVAHAQDSEAGGIDPSSLAASTGEIGSTGSTGSASLSGSGTLPSLGSLATAIEDPPPVIPMTDVDEAGVDRVEPGRGRAEVWWVASEAMQRVLPVEVLPPTGDLGEAPYLYLLDGVNSPQPNGWLTAGGIEGLVGDRDAVTVMPTGGPGSLFADWVEDDPVLSRNKWETFITEELPAVLEGAEARPGGGDQPGGEGLPAAGPRAIGGLSMGAAGAAAIGARNPDLYSGVGGVSGCYSGTDDLGFLMAKLTVESRGGDVRNLWGARSNPAWAEHDVLEQAEGLRGKTLYFSSATGIPADNEFEEYGHDTLDFAIGTTIEQATHACTRALEGRLDDAGIEAEFEYNDTGLHNWRNFNVTNPTMVDTLLSGMGA